MATSDADRWVTNVDGICGYFQGEFQNCNGLIIYVLCRGGWLVLQKSGACVNRQYQSCFGLHGKVLSITTHTTIPKLMKESMLACTAVQTEGGFADTGGLRRRRQRRRKDRHALGPWHIIHTASRASLLTPREGTCRLCRPRGDVMASEAGHDTTPVPWAPIVAAYR